MKKSVLFFALIIGLLTSASTAMAQTTYNLWIAGVQVTSANCSDLSVISGVSGTVKYDPTNKVLTLDGATIQIDTTNAIVSFIDGLTIKVIGTNNLTTGNNSALSFRKPLTITGGGVLNAKSGGKSGGACGIYANKTNLTIDGCTVNAKGGYGIAGQDGSSETLTIKNSIVTAEGTYGSIADFDSLSTIGCSITQPAGAAFDASLHAVALGGSVVTSKVVISPTGGEPNMSRYITLTVADSAEIRLDFKAAAAGTPVRIVSGSNTQDITVGTDWTSTASYTAYGTTMTVYGTIISFDCKNNGARITALDVSNNTQLTGLWCQDNNLNSLDVSKNTQLTHLSCSSNRLSSLDVSKNTQLTALYCYKNDFTTAALDDIYCALPDKTGEWYGVIEPLHNSSDPNHATVLATNKANAIDKNWKVQYYADDTDIPATTGTYECPELNMNRYITLTVAKNKDITLDFKAAANVTPVRIVSGSTTRDIAVGTDWYDGDQQYHCKAQDTTMTIYGSITGFDCSSNFARITALDASNNKSLTQLYCFENQLSSLNISKNRALDTLSCNESQLTNLDVSKNTNLKYLNCSDNKLSILDVSKNTQLTNLSCSENNLDSLDVSKNTELTGLSCSDNKLRDLDVSKNTKLEWLYCAKNPLDSLDVSRNTRLTDLHCYSNQLSVLDVSNNRLLETLECNSNRLTDLNVLQNKRLTQLYCYSNKLSSLSIKRNTQLEKLYCWDNNFSTQALDDIYCALPNRTGKDNGEIFPLRDTSSAAEVDSVGATTAKNATDKNWKVWKYNQVGGNTDITTNGSYDCSTAVADATAEQALTLYPNPVADVLYLSATAHTIHIYNVYGTEVAHATDTDKVEVSHLPAGIYTVKADGTVAKMVKR